MCKSNGGRFQSSSWRALLLAAFLFGVMTLPLAAQQSDGSPPTNALSTPESMQALQLLQRADPLLTKVIVLLLDKDSEIKSLRADLQSLKDQNQIDSEWRQSVNAGRQKLYDDLLAKLTASEMERAKLLTLFGALKGYSDQQSQSLLGIQLQATTVIGDYEAALAGERAQKLGWQIGGVAIAVIGFDLGVKAFTGKDVIEWIITLFK